MTLVLDPPRVQGKWTVAALCKQTILSHGRQGTFAFVARKVPVAILFCDGSSVRAVDLAGRHVETGALEAKCPGLRAAMRARPEGA